MFRLFHDDTLLLWKTEAPQCVVLNTLRNCQMIETLKVWYEYRYLALKEINLSNFHMQDSIWYNKNVSLRHRPLYYYHTWYERERDFVCFSFV